MADVTITYEGSTIASMSATGTKTLLTAGKYCDDDITVDYVSPGGGGGASSLSGYILPAESALSLTIAVLANTSNDMFLLKPRGTGSQALANDPNTLNPNGLRVMGMGFENFTSGEETTWTIASSSSGTSFNTPTRTATSGDSHFNINRNTGVVSSTTQAGGGYFLAGIYYDWWCWSL